MTPPPYILLPPTPSAEIYDQSLNESVRSGIVCTVVGNSIYLLCGFCPDDQEKRVNGWSKTLAVMTYLVDRGRARTILYTSVHTLLTYCMISRTVHSDVHTPFTLAVVFDDIFTENLKKLWRWTLRRLGGGGGELTYLTEHATFLVITCEVIICNSHVHLITTD